MDTEAKQKPEDTWPAICMECGCLVTMTMVRYETIGPHHLYCFSAARLRELLKSGDKR